MVVVRPGHSGIGFAYFTIKIQKGIKSKEVIMLRRMLLAAMLICLIAGLLQARVNEQSKAIAPQSDAWGGLDQSPTFRRCDPPDRGTPPDVWNGLDQSPTFRRCDPPDRGNPPDIWNGLDQSPTFMRYDPPNGGIPQGFDPILWGVWMLMKSFGGGI